MPARYGHESDGLRVVTDLLDEVGGFFHDFVESVFTPFSSVHLVHGNNELPHAKGECKESVLSGLTILGYTSLKLTSATSNDKNGTVSLRGTRNHVLDEITMTRGINDGNDKFWGLELPKSDIDSDTTLTLGLQLVEHPCIFEGTLAKLSSFLLELFDGTLIDTAALVD